MTASQNPKTPSMTMKIRRGVPPEEIGIFCKRASRVTLSQVVDRVTVKEELKVATEALRTQFTVEIKFYPREECEAEYDIDMSDIMATFAIKFPSALKKEILNETRRLDADLRNQLSELGKGKKVRGREREKSGGDDDEADEDDTGRKNAGEESEADGDKRVRQRREQAAYENDEESEQEDDPYGEAAVEAAYAGDLQEDVYEEEEETLPQKAVDQLRVTADLFHRNLHHATSFDFNDSRCEFKVEVSLLHVRKVEQLLILKTISFPRTSPSFCLLESWSGHAAQQLSVRYLALLSVSR